MKLDLVYPTKKLNSVKVGVLTAKLLKIASNIQERMEGKILYELLAAICVGVKAEDLKGLSTVDALRILFIAWQQTHGSDTYIHSFYHTCGAKQEIRHHLDTKVEPFKEYEQTHYMKAPDPETFEHKTWEIKLKPLSVDIEVEIADNEDRAFDIMLGSQIESINGQKPNIDTLPLPLLQQISQLTTKDPTKQLGKITESCGKCGEQFVSSVGLENVDFLLGK